MSTFVLMTIVFITGGQAVATMTTVPGYRSEEACQKAISEIGKLNDMFKKDSRVEVVTVCFPGPEETKSN